MSDKASTRGKRRAEPPARRSLFRRSGTTRSDRGGRRADRYEEPEGLTPELLRQMREPDPATAATPSRPTVPAPRSGPGIREVLAGIESDLGADATYQRAVDNLRP